MRGRCSHSWPAWWAGESPRTLRTESLVPCFPTFQAYTAQVLTQLACTADGLKWLFTLRGVIERVMVAQCKVIAETFVAFCGRVCRDGLDSVSTLNWAVSLSHSSSNPKFQASRVDHIFFHGRATLLVIQVWPAKCVIV